MLKDRVVAAIGDEYDIGDELGRGGMSVVYRALDLRLMRQVAVKVLPPDFAHDSGVRERFRREAQTSAQLSHPNIVPIYSVAERHGVVYFVMAVCEGESLAARLSRTKRPPLDEVTRILTDVSAALSYAHGRGVVHRDIKPDNILIERDTGRALVTDFGIARAAEGGARLTVTGVAMGTPAYMSPEQALGESELDGRSDIYSLGAVAYQMIAGVPPFTATNAPSLLLKHVNEELVPLVARRADVPHTLATVVEKALRKKTADRWQTAGEMHVALQSTVGADKAAVRGSSEGARDEMPFRIRSARTVVPVTVPDKVAEHSLASKPHPPDAALLNRRIARLRWFAKSTTYSFLLLMVAAMTDSEAMAVFMLMLGFPALAATAVQAGILRGSGVGFLAAVRAKRRTTFELLPGRRKKKELKEPAVSPEVLAGPFGDFVHAAMFDSADIERTFAALSPSDREMLPEVLPTVKSLVDRVVTLVPALHDVEKEVSFEDVERITDRIASLERSAGQGAPPSRTLELLRRQHASLADLTERRDVLLAQVERAVLLLRNIRLDLRKVGSAGLGASFRDVNSATQEARALSHDIGHVLSVADELRRL